ncbi:MAG: substrate binding domain-containing protein, partial [Myxococcota bacterium]
TTRALHPTDEGTLLIEGCRDVVELWQRTLEDARAQRAELEGVVQLAAPVDTAYQLLRSVVAELHAEHPRLTVVLHGTDTVQQLDRDAVDVSIRYGRLQDSTMSARKLAVCPGILVAAPSYLQRKGVPRSPADLQSHQCITLHLSNRLQDTWELLGKGRPRRVELVSPLCGDGYAARQWALDGAGIALKSLFDVIDDLEHGRLVRVLPRYTSGLVPIHAVFPNRRFTTARVRTLLSVVAKRFAVRSNRCTTWLRS